MIRFALVVASVLGFVLTAALGNMMVPLLRELQRAARGTQPDSDAPDSPVPTMGGLCLMVGTLAAVGVGWLAACAAQPSLLGSDRQMTSRLLIALLGSLAFGAVGLADDLARIRSRYPNGLGLGLRRTQRLALECIAAVLVLGLLALNGCLPTGLILPGAGYVECALAPLLWAVLLVAMAEAARVADGADGTVCGAAFVAMLGLMMLETQLGWFPLAVFPAALAGALMEYKYITEDAPEKVVKRTMNQNRANRQAEKPAPRGKKAAPRKKKRTIFLPALFGITIAFALACLALCWMILNDSSNLMNSKADVTLGDYIGMTKDQAMATDQIASGQISPEREEEYNSNYAAGYIYKQSPVSGRTVREGQSVTLTVSLGTQYVTVPDLTNYVQTDAEQQLKALGVSVLVTQAVDTSVASGAVIRTDPAAGTQVAAGSTVILYISRPQVSTTTKVPSLTGMSVDDARTLLVQNHLGLGSQSEEYSDQPAGTVLSQNPAAGTTAKLNSRVNVVVSAGAAPVQEPEQPGGDGTTSGTTGEGSTGGESTGGSSEPSSSSSSTGGGILDWWSSLLG